MEKEDLKLIKYNASISVDDIKVGMKIIDVIEQDDKETKICVFDVLDVDTTSKDEITFKARAVDHDQNKVHDYIYDIDRGTKLKVYFSSIKEGLKFGIKRKDIEIT